MADLATLQRVVDELKRKRGINLKSISNEIQIQYVYVTKQINGTIKLTDNVYNKIMAFARNQGVDTTVLTTKQRESLTATTPTLNEKLSGIVNIQIKIVDNNIAGVEWALNPIP
jgi:hypothetical protein